MKQAEYAPIKQAFESSGKQKEGNLFPFSSRHHIESRQELEKSGAMLRAR